MTFYQGKRAEQPRLGRSLNGHRGASRCGEEDGGRKKGLTIEGAETTSNDLGGNGLATYAGRRRNGGRVGKWGVTDLMDS